jgi:hypothetical protein
MSNRIAAFRPADAREFAQSMPPAPANSAFSVAVDRLREALASRVPAGLSARLRRDVGLPTSIGLSTMADTMLGAEARRLGF